MYPTAMSLDTQYTARMPPSRRFAHHFHNKERIGFKLLNIESNIVIRVLVELAKMGRAALPFHDCVMVPAGASAMAQKPVIKKTKCDVPRIEKAP